MSKFNNKLIGSIYRFLMNSVLCSTHCYPYLSLFLGCESPVQMLNSFVTQIMIFLPLTLITPLCLTGPHKLFMAINLLFFSLIILDEKFLCDIF